MKRFATVLVAALALLVAGGCGGTPSAQPAREGTATAGSGVAADAVRDLSRRLGVAPERVTVVSAEKVTWRDSSLGCPRQGMMYAQALTDGSRVVLEAQGRRYDYHAGGRRPAFLCEHPQPPAGR